MNKLLIICGPTATGKTQLGIHLAKKFNGEIISADSRQVYRGMDIGTGKDVLNLEFKTSDLSWRNQQLGYYLADGTKIWGYDLASPNQDFSVGQYAQLGDSVIKDIINRNKLPILVGGTGLYLKALTQPLETISIPPNHKLRKELDTLSTEKLKIKLSKISSRKFSSMNQSDQNNPRRLIRAIEIEEYQHQHSHLTKTSSNHYSNQLWIGLKTNHRILDNRIKQSVISRATAQFSHEIQQLNSQKFDWDSPAASATGYKQWQSYLDGKTSLIQAIVSWTKAETQYARRQLTWFNKQSQINWFDIGTHNWQHQVERVIQDWYSKSN